MPAPDGCIRVFHEGQEPRLVSNTSPLFSMNQGSFLIPPRCSPLPRLITTLNVAGDTVAARSVEAIVKGRRQDDIENTSTVDLNTSSL
jgi:hypothetical protein